MEMMECVPLNERGQEIPFRGMNREEHRKVSAANGSMNNVKPSLNLWGTPLETRCSYGRAQAGADEFINDPQWETAR